MSIISYGFFFSMCQMSDMLHLPDPSFFFFFPSLSRRIFLRAYVVDVGRINYLRAIF